MTKSEAEVVKVQMALLAFKSPQLKKAFNDGTIDLVVGTLNQDTTGTAALATAADTIKC